MNIKSHVVIEIKKDDHVFSFSMPVGAPFGKAYDAAFEVLQQVVEFSRQAADSTKPQDPVN